MPVPTGQDATAPILVSLSFAHPHVHADDRAALAIAEEDLEDRLAAVTDGPAEFAVLSTCLRHELVAIGCDHKRLHELACEMSGLDTLPEHAQYRYGRHVVDHLFRVASGLCSPVVGEPEILGQVRRAHRSATQAGTTGPALDQLFREAIHTARLAHDLFGDVDAGSIAGIAADVVLADAPGHVALVGAGAMANAVHDRLVTAVGDDDRWSIVRLTRTPSRLGDDALGFEHLEDELVTADRVVTAISSPTPLIDADMLRRVTQRRGTPLRVVDLGMPANVAHGADTAATVEHVGIDVLAQDDTHRIATDEAEAMIEVRAYEVHARIVNSQLTPMIRALRQKAETATDEELTRAFARLGDLDDTQRAVISQMARTLSNRLLHDPLMYLSSHPEATATSDTARELLGIEDV